MSFFLTCRAQTASSRGASLAHLSHRRRMLDHPPPPCPPRLSILPLAHSPPALPVSLPRLPCFPLCPLLCFPPLLLLLLPPLLPAEKQHHRQHWQAGSSDPVPAVASLDTCYIIRRNNELICTGTPYNSSLCVPTRPRRSQSPSERRLGSFCGSFSRLTFRR